MTKTITTLVIAFLFSMTTTGQSTPEPPTPPQKSTGTSYSISIDNDDDDKSNSSVSVTKTDDEYKFKARFHKSKTDRVKNLLLERLGKGNLTVKGNTYLWSDLESGDEIFECKLTSGNLRMFMDRELVSNGFYKKIDALGTDLKHMISGTDAKKMAAQDLKRAQQDVERAQKDLERAKARLEKSKN